MQEYKLFLKILKEQDPESYNIAKGRGNIEMICSELGFDIPKKQWTLKDCMEEAKKFDDIKTWEDESPLSYKAASYHNWLDVCTEHMKRKTNNYYFNQCVDDFLKYNQSKIVPWSKSPLYHYAYRRKWKNKITSLGNKPMKKLSVAFYKEKNSIFVRVVFDRKKMAALVFNSVKPEYWDDKNKDVSIIDDISLRIKRHLKKIENEIKDLRYEMELLELVHFDLLKQKIKSYLLK